MASFAKVGALVANDLAGSAAVGDLAVDVSTGITYVCQETDGSTTTAWRRHDSRPPLGDTAVDPTTGVAYVCVTDSGESSGTWRSWLVLNSGDNPALGNGVSVGRVVHITEGTAAAPVTAGAPTFKVVRTVAVTQATIDALGGTAGNDGGDVMGAIVGNAEGTAACEVQPVGVYAKARTVSTVGNPGNDAAGIYAQANVSGDGTGRAIGGVLYAYRNSVEVTAAATGVEILCGNSSGVDEPYTPTTAPLMMGVWVNAYGPKYSSAGIVLGNAYGQQFDVGIAAHGLVSGGFTGGIRTNVLRDDSNCVTTFKVNGTKTGYVLDFSGATLSGGTAILGPNNKTLLAARNAANNADAALVSLNASDQLVLGSGAAQISTVKSIAMTDATNLVLGTSTGNKIGTTTSQKIAFWNKTPIVQPTTGIAAATFVANSGTAVNDASTFGGYTLGKIAAALINTGILA